MNASFTGLSFYRDSLGQENQIKGDNWPWLLLFSIDKLHRLFSHHCRQSGSCVMCFKTTRLLRVNSCGVACIWSAPNNTERLAQVSLNTTGMYFRVWRLKFLRWYFSKPFPRLQRKMLSAKKSFLLLVAFLVFTDHSDAWQRRRRCPLQNCQVSSWSYWSSCSASQCIRHGSQSRSRTEETSPSCGGAPCPELYETRQCYGTTPIDCQLSSWSE